MKLIPFEIRINQRPPFIGLFTSSTAALETYIEFAFLDAAALGGCKLSVRPWR